MDMDRKKRVILWNDSWLISTLHQSLVNLSGNDLKETLTLKENLEEILLNKKRHYSLLKRKIDNQNFIKKIFEYINIDNSALNELIEKENKKLINASNNNNIIKVDDYLNSSQSEALDSLYRIDELMAEGDLECLDSIITTESYSIEKIVENTLCQLKSEGTLLDFITIINKDRQKVGLPNHKDLLDEIYLYNGEETFKFNEISLSQQIDAIRKNVPWLYIYIVPSIHVEKNTELVDNILDMLAQKIAEKARERLQELFPNSQICS